MAMSNKSDSFILNEFWANGIPLGAPGGASGTALHLPVAIRTIAGVTPGMTGDALNVTGVVGQITTIGGATPTFTGGAQHFILAGASLDITVDIDQNEVQITTLAGVTPMMIDRTLGVAVKTTGGATPTFTGGAQHFILTGASPVDATYIGDIKFGEALPAGTNVIGSVTFGVLPAGTNIIGVVSATVTLIAGGQVSATATLLAATGRNIGTVDVSTVGALEQTALTLTNATIVSADTEYYCALPANCRALQFQCRTGNDVRYSLTAGKVATPVEPYFTLKAGGVYYKENLKLAAATLCLAADAGTLKVEVEAWS